LHQLHYPDKKYNAKSGECQVGGSLGQRRDLASLMATPCGSESCNRPALSCV
jgi:hypothetical protein